MRGRYPSGPEFVDKLHGSALAKERLRVLLETVARDRRIGDACAYLGISAPRFDQIRIEGLQGALTALEPQPAGRRPRPTVTDEAEVQRLRERIAQLEGELQAALVRAEIAVALPQVKAAAEKKTTQPRRRQPPRAKKPS
jgi:hypothetical protein